MMRDTSVVDTELLWSLDTQSLNLLNQRLGVCMTLNPLRQKLSVSGLRGFLKMSTRATFRSTLVLT